MICWIESVDPVADLCLTNQIYSELLNASELREISEVQNAHLKMLLEAWRNANSPMQDLQMLRNAARR